MKATTHVLRNGFQKWYRRVKGTPMSVPFRSVKKRIPKYSTTRTVCVTFPHKYDLGHS